MSKKAIYRHKKSGDLFAIGTLSVVLHEVARIRKVAVNNKA